jgi:two-component system, LytTR family, sensor kinase
MLLAFFVNDLNNQPLTADNLVLLLIIFISITLIWHVNRALIFYFRKRYSEKRKLLLRLFMTFLTGSLATTFVIWITGALRYLSVYGNLTLYFPMRQTASITVNKMTIALSVFGFDLVQAVINFAFFMAIYETMFFIRESSYKEKKLREAEREREKLRAANLQSQLDALKQQVNPHFLFNSLNVLDSLIEDDPRQARIFLEELSTVYRYLLRSNEQHLTDLECELDFIQSYYHLLKTRHGSGLQLNIDIDKRFKSSKLPPLTLQLLVENAFKHNIVLPEQPLIIDITTDNEGHLLVQNNIQRKNVRVASNGVGLSNILSKYHILNQASPSIREDNGKFVVRLPMITMN